MGFDSGLRGAVGIVVNIFSVALSCTQEEVPANRKQKET